MIGLAAFVASMWFFATGLIRFSETGSATARVLLSIGFSAVGLYFSH